MKNTLNRATDAPPSASREWTRVTTAGDTPVGRYGHAAAMVGTRFFVFGGQVEGHFLNDLWAFDLNTRTLVSFRLEDYLDLIHIQ